MDEDNSNDVVLIDDDDSKQEADTDIVESTEAGSEESDRPLLLLFKRLVANDTKTNTVLTNAQIMLIMEKEFDMKVAHLHNLLIEIYISIVKKCLKEWPRWDTFDRVITKLRAKPGNSKKINSLLEKQYFHLKENMKKMLEETIPIAEEAVLKLQTMREQLFKSMGSETSNTVLEIYCTRRQLNKFIYNQPNPEESNSIFNLVKFEQYKLDPQLPHYSFSSILHWYGVRLSIELKNFGYTRFTTHRLQHTLVNRFNGLRNSKENLEEGICMKPLKNVQAEEFPISEIYAILNNVLEFYTDKIEYDMIKAIFQVIKSDLNIDSSTIEIPGMYKTICSQYPYIRKLCTEVSEAKDSNYDFYIEEKITPIQDWHIGKVLRIEGPPQIPPLQTWLKFECGECKQKFNGAEFLTLLRDHFRVYHTDESNWTCTNCYEEFDMALLTNSGWQHTCC